MSDSKKDDGIDYFLKLVETQGVACSTVKDGHIIMFKRSWLQSLLDSHPDNSEITIFIQRPDFKN